MNELIIRFLQGRATPEERERLQRWREEAPKNERTYRALAELWSLTGHAAPAMDAGELPDVDRLIERAEAGEAETLAGEPGRVPAEASPSLEPSVSTTARDARSRWTRHAGVGAMAASLVAVGFGLAALADGPDTPGPLADSEIVTGAGEMTTLTLGDGSSVRIGPESRLRLVQEDDGITARLDGRAFFGVQTDPSRKFTVKTDYGEAEVFGTRFEVRSENEEFRVMVVDGKVQVSAGGAAVEVAEGEMSRSGPGGRPTASKVADVYRHLDWMGNALVFHGTPLGRVADELERRYGVDVYVEDPELTELTVSGTFTDQTLDEVLLVVCEIVGARCVHDDERVEIQSGLPGVRSERSNR